MTDGAFEKTLERFAKPKNWVELAGVQIKEWGGGWGEEGEEKRGRKGRRTIRTKRL